MSRFGELYAGYDQQVADTSRIGRCDIPGETLEERRAELASALARQKALEVEAITTANKAVADKAAEMGEAVRTINFVLGQLREEGLDISIAYEMAIRNLTSKGGDFVVCLAGGTIGKKLAAQTIAIYRDSMDTQEMGDKVADIFGLLAD